jgi:hypothetical protein
MERIVCSIEQKLVESEAGHIRVDDFKKVKEWP